MGCEVNKAGELELVFLSPGTGGMGGKRHAQIPREMEQTPEQERWARLLDVPDMALPSCSLGTDLATEHVCPDVRAVGSSRGLSPARFPSGQHRVHSRTNVRLPSWAEVKRVTGPEESSRTGTRGNAARGK